MNFAVRVSMNHLWWKNMLFALVSDGNDVNSGNIFGEKNLSWQINIPASASRQGRK
jgi:hypothetical protein